MRKCTQLLLGCVTSLALPCIAMAQNPQPAPPNVTHPPVASPSAPQPPPEQIAPKADTLKGTTLSDKLSAQQGTLRPPAVDPGIAAPMPQHSQGTMPVIPPPGTPGGNQKVVPK